MGENRTKPPKINDAQKDQESTKKERGCSGEQADGWERRIRVSPTPRLGRIYGSPSQSPR